jgi:hypothetical protein
MRLRWNAEPGLDVTDAAQPEPGPSSDKDQSASG